MTVKKLVTGSGKASKKEVASALCKFVGSEFYDTEDESDAVAVGIAWLIQEKMVETNRRGGEHDADTTAF